MATGDIAAVGGVANLMALLQNFTGQGGTTKSNQNTTGSTTQSGTSNQSSQSEQLQNLISAVTGMSNQTQVGTTNQVSNQTGTTTQSGANTSTQTTRSDITAEGINKMLQDALSADSGGIAAISMGERSAGGYNSTSRQLLQNDLLSRTAGELARLQAGTTTTTTGSTNQSTNQSIVGNTNTATNATTQGNTSTNTNQSTNTSGTASQTGTTAQTGTSNQNQSAEIVKSVDPTFDPMKALGLILGAQVAGPSLESLFSDKSSAANPVGSLIGLVKSILGGDGYTLDVNGMGMQNVGASSNMISGSAGLRGLENTLAQGLTADDWSWINDQMGGANDWEQWFTGG